MYIQQTPWYIHANAITPAKPTPIYPQQKRQQYQPIQVPNPAVLIVSMKTYMSILKTRSNFGRLTNCFLFRLLTLFLKLFLKPKSKLSSVLRTCSYHIRSKYIHSIFLNCLLLFDKLSQKIYSSLNCPMLVFYNISASW